MHGYLGVVGKEDIILFVGQPFYRLLILGPLVSFHGGIPGKQALA